MTHFANTCIAKDRSGEAKIFRRGDQWRLRHESCPQVDGNIVTVRHCFYQQTLETDGLAVLLEEMSWAYCRDLEEI